MALWRGAGRICAAGETVICLTGSQECELAWMFMLVTVFFMLWARMHIGVHVFQVVWKECLCVWFESFAVSINARPCTSVSMQPCVTSNICSPASLPSESGRAVAHSGTLPDMIREDKTEHTPRGHRARPEASRRPEICLCPHCRSLYEPGEELH